MDYALRPNKLNNQHNSHLAHVVHTGTATMTDVLNQMTAEGSAIKESEAQGNILEFFKAVNHFLQLGYTVSLDFLKLRYSITGVFDGADDSYDPARHQLNVKVNPGPFFKTSSQQIVLNKVRHQAPRVTIHEVFDFATKTTNGKLTLSGMVTVRGAHMRIDDNDPQQGVYLLMAGQPEVKVAHVRVFNASELVFQVPNNLVPGFYQLEVRAKLKDTKDYSRGTLDNLTVLPTE